ncbi:hypothetical protein, partial [Pseudomonas sp. AB12(2023)]|uniref:hypothetical protein n=1 Tax=Pseudomonas sp. AB12(2023) TaxID=3048597 RepID=UPI002B22A496
MKADVHQLKLQELEIWNAALDNEALRKTRPEFYHGGLEAHAEALHRLGVIDAAECSDLKQQAQAAYSD